MVKYLNVSLQEVNNSQDADSYLDVLKTNVNSIIAVL